MAQLFRHGYARGTIALWLTYFMGLFVIYLLNGWLPTILRSGGLSLQQAAMMTGLFQLGGPLGGILVGMLMDRASAKAVIAATYFLGCLCLLSQGVMDFGSAALSVLILSAGCALTARRTVCRPIRPPIIKPRSALPESAGCMVSAVPGLSSAPRWAGC